MTNERSSGLLGIVNTKTEQKFKQAIVVTKHGLVVDGFEVQTRNRWEAKVEASRLSAERGIPWYSLKSNGKLVAATK